MMINEIIEALSKKSKGIYRQSENGNFIFIIKNENENTQWYYIKENNDIEMRKTMIDLYKSMYKFSTLSSEILSLILVDNPLNRIIIDQLFFDQKRLVNVEFFDSTSKSLTYRLL